MWVTDEKLMELTGWTWGQIKGKVQRGVLVRGVHWCKIDGARMFNPEAIQEWLNTQASAQRLEALRSGTPTSTDAGGASGSKRTRRMPTSRMRLGTDAA